MHYDLHEGAHPGTETVLLSAGLGGVASYWQPQMAALQSRRVIAYDHAGTGRNRVNLPDGYSIAAMAQDVLAILDASNTPSCHFVGHALGGLVGLEFARHHPHRLRSLTVVNGWAKADAHTKRCFAARLTLLRAAGAEAYVRAQPIFLYPASWLAEHEARMQQEDAHALAGFQGEDSLLRRIDALLAFDATPYLAALHVPVLLIAAQDDVLVACTQSERLAAAIPEAELHLARSGGHALNVSEPEAFNVRLLTFLNRHAS